MSSQVGTSSGKFYQTNLANATSIAADANGIFIVGSGGGGAVTITGDTGSDTGSTFAFTATPNSGATAAFNVTTGAVDLTLTDINANTLIGQAAGSANTLLADGGGSNTTVGALSGASLGSASNNVLVGYIAAAGLLTGNSNVIVGSSSGANYAGAESGNILLGNFGVVGESDVIHIGDAQTSCFIAGIAGVTTSNTEFVTIDTTTGEMGSAASSNSITINGDTGSASGTTLNLKANNQAGSTPNFSCSGSTINLTMLDFASNLCLGNNSTTISGSRNVGYGDGSLGVLSTGTDSCAYGHRTLANVSSGLANTAVGSKSLENLLTGNLNTCIGYLTGQNYTSSESNNILIGEGLQGTVGESGVIRIGVSTDQTSCFIAGINGSTVTGTAVLCATNGQLGTVVSSARFKENIQELRSSRITDLTPVSFNYKKPHFLSDDSIHYGMIAEDVEKYMPELVLYDEEKRPLTIKYHEMYALLLAEIKSLKSDVEYLKNKAA